MTPRTLFQKVWDDHLVFTVPGGPALLYCDLHLLHELTSPQAFAGLRRRGVRVRRPDLTLATADHSTPTTRRGLPIVDRLVADQVAELERNCREFDIPCYGLSSDRQGIVHVIGPELALTQPGMTVVCGDSHTSTNGAVGALAISIGTSEVETVLATQSLLQMPLRSFSVEMVGRLRDGVTAKDLVLALIAEIGFGGAAGYVVEYRGSAIRAMTMDERMTVCNMSIEAGAKAGLIAPDETTYAYLHGRPFAPRDAAWDAAVARWRTLPTDDGAIFDRGVTIDADAVEPMITFGTNPAMGIPISGVVPDPDAIVDPVQRQNLLKALRYMDLPPGRPLLGHAVDVVFIGSCANSRISDLRAAAGLLKGRKVHPDVRMMVVPGSSQIRSQAVAEGLADIFREAGADFRESGCSMCVAINGDAVSAGQYCVSTSNRNFEGRQGLGARTLLASPLTATAAAITGTVTDVRTLL
jgi:3-isopropylmalate/(R)-2-methylmalate dehydratase large subunit